MLRCLKALFNFGNHLYDLDFKNPCVGLNFYAIDKTLKYIPSDTEIDAVKKKCDKEEHLLIEFVQDTGARIGEALRLSNKDVFQDYVVLYTRKSKNSNLMPRKVPRPECLPCEEYNKPERIFKHWTDQPRFLEKKVKELKQRPWAWHNLRHRYASRLSKEGRPLFEIMSLLGHSNLSTTQNYLQLLP